MHVMVIDKENGGKADALNAGINASTAPYFVSLDADSILDQRALKELMRVIQEDPRVVAVGGQVAIANGCTIQNSRVVSVGLPHHAARPVPDGGVSAVVHHRAHRARPDRLDPHPLAASSRSSRRRR